MRRPIAVDQTRLVPQGRAFAWVRRYSAVGRRGRPMKHTPAQVPGACDGTRWRRCHGPAAPSTTSQAERRKDPVTVQGRPLELLECQDWDFAIHDDGKSEIADPPQHAAAASKPRRRL